MNNNTDRKGVELEKWESRSKAGICCIFQELHWPKVISDKHKSHDSGDCKNSTLDDAFQRSRSFDCTTLHANIVVIVR